jgi:hypothetical protein
MAYDPIPDLAALIDGLHELARSSGSGIVLGEILAGPYARLRGGLLLDEITWEDPPGTEDALRELLAAPGTDPARPCIVCGKPLPHETCGPVIIGASSRR